MIKTQIKHGVCLLHFNLKFHLCFPKTYVVHDKHSFEEIFREKSFPESILERRFVLGRLIALNSLKLMGKIMKYMELLN